MLPVVVDTCTDTAGTSATAHTAELGGPITDILGTSNAVFTASNRIRNNQSAASSFQYSSASPTANAVVEASIYCASAIGLLGISLRHSNGIGYILFWNSGDWFLQGGNLNMFAAQSLTPGQRYKAKLSAVGSTITAYIDGTQILQGTDTQIPGPGTFGFSLNSSATDSTGLQIDEFVAFALPSTNQATLYSYMHDGSGNVEAGKSFYLQIQTSGTGVGSWSNNPVQSSASDSTGYSAILAEIGATYRASLDQKNWSAPFQLPNSSTTALRELIGSF